ncbi:MAG: tetratricopeptide repeat protein [Spirochaetota bacterium]|nr:tetratricopeptide repeat protein [Spirochaetota bacterium]
MLTVLLLIVIIIIGILIYYFLYIAPKIEPKNRAESFIKQNMFEEAILEYKKILDLEPSNYYIHFKIAELYKRLGKNDEVVSHLKEVISIDKYDTEVDRIDVKKRLAKAYYIQGNIGDAFQTYLDVLSIYPDDVDAVYHVSFITLGQEEFGIAKRYFDRLLKLRKDDFEIYFGAGISSYQNNKIDDAVNYFQEAVSIRPQSDIANLAIGIALLGKENYREAISYLKKLADRVTHVDVQYISKRLLAFTLILANKVDEGEKIFEELLEFARSNNMQDNVLLTLYDLGFTCLKLEKPKHAQKYWNELYQLDRDYDNIEVLLENIKRDNEASSDFDDGFEMTAHDYIEDWEANAFPSNFLWDICGLKSDKKFDIKNVLVKTKITDAENGEKRIASDSVNDSNDRIEKFLAIDTESFRITSNRVISKMGYKVDEILQTYRESDGVDFIAYSEENKKKVLIWVRRWGEAKVGEITLRNFAQGINDAKVEIGLFISTAMLTEPAERSLKKLNKVVVIYPDELNDLLRGLI